jgi:hypothetical protein
LYPFSQILFDHIAFFFQKARGSGYKYPSRIQPDHADSPETIKQYQHAPLVGCCRVKIAPVAGATEGVNLDGGVKTPISALRRISKSLWLIPGTSHSSGFAQAPLADKPRWGDDP